MIVLEASGRIAGHVKILDVMIEGWGMRGASLTLEGILVGKTTVKCEM